MRDDELIRVDEFAKNLCREMGCLGAEFALEVVGTQNAVLLRAKQGDFTLYRESRPYPFALDGLEEVHGALRISLNDAAVLSCGFMGNPDHKQALETQAVTPAPVAEVELDEPTNTGPKFSMTKAAMVEQHKHQWPTIERDMTDASKNRLASAKAGKRGWNEADALAWARANNKLVNTSNTVSSLTQGVNSMSSLPGRKHTQER